MSLISYVIIFWYVFKDRWIWTEIIFFLKEQAITFEHVNNTFSDICKKIDKLVDATTELTKTQVKVQGQLDLFLHSLEELESRRATDIQYFEKSLTSQVNLLDSEVNSKYNILLKDIETAIKESDRTTAALDKRIAELELDKKRVLYGVVTVVGMALLSLVIVGKKLIWLGY